MKSKWNPPKQRRNEKVQDRAENREIQNRKLKEEITDTKVHSLRSTELITKKFSDSQ